MLLRPFPVSHNFANLLLLWKVIKASNPRLTRLLFSLMPVRAATYCLAEIVLDV